MRVEINPELIRWARERAGLSLNDLARRTPQLPKWEAGETNPTFKQLEAFAKNTHVPIGYLFLQDPPVETIPIPDFRTMGGSQPGRPSPDLLDTIYICQQRQEWYREFARSVGETPLAFVGASNLQSNIVNTATDIRRALDFDLQERRETPTWTEALRHFIEQADNLGVLVMVSGVVGSNNRRKLNPDEFRGFALSDKHAPLVFINGADSKAAQMFTLAHELAHIWLGESALSDVSPVTTPDNRVEIWCNQVAAEILTPLNEFRAAFRSQAGDLGAETTRLARMFKVSTLVILRRLHDAGIINRDRMWSLYNEELRRILAVDRGSGGDFYLTQAARVSKRFARALVVSTLEGQTLHRDAFRLLGFSKLQTFKDLGHRLGVI